MRFTNSLQKVFLEYLEFFHVKITFRSSKHNFQVVFLAVKSISFLGWVLNLLTLRNTAINCMVSFTTINSVSPQKRWQWCWWRFVDVGAEHECEQIVEVLLVITKLVTPTHFAPNIRQQHRCIPWNPHKFPQCRWQTCVSMIPSPTPNKSDLLK